MVLALKLLVIRYLHKVDAKGKNVENCITLKALKGIPLVKAGDDLCDLVSHGLAAAEIIPSTGDILVFAQKIISKSEGRTVDLRFVRPGAQAKLLAEQVQKDPRIVELILSESKSIIRQKIGVLIVEHKRGWIMANAGIDASNVCSAHGEENVLLLPADPEASAAKLQCQLSQQFDCQIGVVVSDSFGRPWRIGTTGVAIGAAGFPALWDRRGETDLFGKELLVTQQAVADEVATAAALLQGQAAEGNPIVHLRGLNFSGVKGAYSRPASDLIRDVSEDLFR